MVHIELEVGFRSRRTRRSAFPSLSSSVSETLQEKLIVCRLGLEREKFDGCVEASLAPTQQQQQQLPANHRAPDQLVLGEMTTRDRQLWNTAVKIYCVNELSRRAGTYWVKYPVPDLPD